MPGTGHSHRYKSSISNRNSKSAFQVLAPWNKGKLGKPGQVPTIGKGGGDLQFSSHLNLDSVTLSANSVHFDSSGGPTHSLGIDSNGCLAHTAINDDGTVVEDCPFVFKNGITTNSIALESSSTIPTAVIDRSSGICGSIEDPVILTGTAGFIKIPRCRDVAGYTITSIDAYKTLWFWVSNVNFTGLQSGGMLFLQFCQRSAPSTFVSTYSGDPGTPQPPTYPDFIDPGGITVMWSEGGCSSDTQGGCDTKVLFGLHNPFHQSISFGLPPEIWTLSIYAQTITQSIGAIVTQGSITGTLKTALTGDWNENVVIQVGTTGDEFTSTADVVIGTGSTATTILAANITGATLQNPIDIGNVEETCNWTAPCISWLYVGAGS